jgi:hypothetical protein
MRSGFQRHPWTVRIPISGLPIMPNEVAWFEDGLASLAGVFERADGPDDEFIFGLERILDGIEALVSSR